MVHSSEWPVVEELFEPKTPRSQLDNLEKMAAPTPRSEAYSPCELTSCF
jgi:hypothetical protein